MPLVMVKSNSAKVPGTILSHITLYLREWTAEALSVPDTDGELHPNEVTVHASDSNGFDRTCADLEVTVFANWYPARAANLDERRQLLAEKLRTFLAGSRTLGVSGSVWILLQDPTSFGGFQT